MNDHLIPAPALARTTAAVKKAEARAVELQEASREAVSRTVTARGKVAMAGQHDAEALAEAAREGREPPAASEPKAKADLQAAKAAAALLAEDAKQALIDRDRAIRNDQPALIAKQAPAAKAARARAHELREQLVEAMDELALEDAVLREFRRADQYVDSTTRGRRYTAAGTLQFHPSAVGAGANRTIRPQPKPLLEAVGELVDQYDQANSETVGERQAREQAEAKNRPTTFGRGDQRVGQGVFVP